MMKAVGLAFLSLARTAAASNSDEHCTSNGALSCTISPCDSPPSWTSLTSEHREYYTRDGWTQTYWENNRALGKGYVYDDLLWEHICDEEKAKLEAKGWNEKKWELADQAVAWGDLSPEEQVDLESLGITEEMFDYDYLVTGSDPHHWDMHSPGGDFSPRVIKVGIPELKRLDIEHLKTLDFDVGLAASSALEPNEEVVGETSLEEYISRMLSGDATGYLQIEDKDEYKPYLQSVLGEAVIKNISDALVRNEIEEFKEELWDLAPDWSMFLGAKGSLTSMHFDTDRFNFLYVIEGRKRIVLIPNKGLADQRYQPKKVYNGSGWSGVDVLSDLDGLPDDAVVLELGPGEGVAIPYRAWHAVENLEHTLAYGLRIL